MNDALRADSDTIAQVGDPGAGDAAEHFLLRLPGRTLDARGCHATLPSGGTATLDARARAFFAREGRTPALLVGAVPFDPKGDDALYQPASLAEGVAEVVTPALPFSGDIHAEPSAAQYADAVRQALAGLHDGDGELKKVVLARTLRVHSRAAIDPRALVARLGHDPDAVTYLCPLPVAAGDAPAWLVGASPELLVSRRGPQILSHPLAGSARRRPDPDEDAQAARELLGSAKDHDEHRYVVDAIVAALRPYCERIDAAARPTLHATTTLWHLGTRIEARLRDPSTSVATLLAALHPTPAVCGTPAALALDTIRRLEPVQRGFYAGAVGWMDAHGDGDWYVAIRCARVQGHQARIHAGAGIVAGSEPAAEVAETGVKFGALLAALGADAAPRIEGWTL
ncbi:isochorismate synthase [Stenotrophomonas rhizophila]|uniref:isochorismate synthase n=1 Tax=Stenotrophomonas rhizophila TaxID=216778 RepID=UPI000BA74A1B|nr:isochorismate synthase [Stenotrophomonas rhizophila]PAK91549.1 isochorismate synthase [Stenotrophomonas rhizophila]